MTNGIERTATTQPRWRRILDFPLMAMLLSIVAIVAVAALWTLFTKYALPNDKSIFAKSWQTLVGLALFVITFQFTNARLGAVRRNDLPAAGALRYVALGVIVGTLLFSFVIGEAALARVYWIVGAGDASQFWKALIGTALSAGILEEIVFRGILQRWLEEFGGTTFGLIASSVLFGLAHSGNPGVTPLAIVVIVFAGLWLGTAYKLTGSLWYPIALHAAWNFAQGEIWDVPVSGGAVHGLLDARVGGPAVLTGGAFGLESSLFALIALVLISAWQTNLVFRRRLTMPNWWARRRASQEAVRVDVDRHAGFGTPFHGTQPVADNVLDVEAPRRVD